MGLFLGIIVWLLIVVSACGASHLFYLQGHIDGLREAGEIYGVQFPPRQRFPNATAYMLLFMTVMLTTIILLELGGFISK